MSDARRWEVPATAIVLIGFFVVGDRLHHWLLPTVPPAVIGMLLLFTIFLLRGDVPGWLERGISRLLRHFTLYLLPPSVGVIAIWPQIAARAGAVIGTLVISTLATLVFVGTLYARASDKRNQV